MVEPAHAVTLAAMAPTTQPVADAPAAMPARAAALILDAFLDYNGRYSDITRRAQRHFERRDWRRAQLDAIARIDLYDVCIAQTLAPQGRPKRRI